MVSSSPEVSNTSLKLAFLIFWSTGWSSCVLGLVLLAPLGKYFEIHKEIYIIMSLYLCINVADPEVILRDGYTIDSTLLNCRS